MRGLGRPCHSSALGRFLGFGAKQVSDGEQAMLDRVREAVTA